MSSSYQPHILLKIVLFILGAVTLGKYRNFVNPNLPYPFYELLVAILILSILSLLFMSSSPFWWALDLICVILIASISYAAIMILKDYVNDFEQINKLLLAIFYLSIITIFLEILELLFRRIGMENEIVQPPININANINLNPEHTVSKTTTKTTPTK
jgi:hypothetical protein